MKKIRRDAKRIICGEYMYTHTYIIFVYNSMFFFFYGPDIGSVEDDLSQLYAPHRAVWVILRLAFRRYVHLSIWSA